MWEAQNTVIVSAGRVTVSNIQKMQNWMQVLFLVLCYRTATCQTLKKLPNPG